VDGDLILLLALLSVSVLSDPATALAASLLAALASSLAGIPVRAEASGWRIRLRTRSHLTILAVQRGDTVYVLDASAPVEPGDVTITLDPARELVHVGSETYRARILPAKEKVEYAIYVSP